MLEHKVTVQKHGLHFGENAVFAVQIAPAGLHHPNLGVREKVHGSQKEVSRRNEIGVENGKQLAGSGFEPFLQRAGLEAAAGGAVPVFDCDALGPIFDHEPLGVRVRFVSGVVENLDLKQVARVVEFGYLFQKAGDNKTFVEERQLDGHLRERREMNLRLPRKLLAVLEVDPHRFEAMQTVHGKDNQDGEIRNQ